jgi:hypothetical protein
VVVFVKFFLGGNGRESIVAIMNGMVFDGSRFSGGGLSLGAPITQRMSNLNLAIHVLYMA